MKRVINVRPFLIAFVSLMLGILAYTFLFLTNALWATVLGVAIAFFAFILLGVTIWSFTVKKPTKINVFVYMKRYLFLIALIFVVLGTSFMGVRHFVYNSTLHSYDGVYYVAGDIEDNMQSGEDYTLITLKNVVLSDSTESYVLRSGLTVFVYATDLGDVNASYTMEFQATIEKVNFENSEYNFLNYNNKTAYHATVLNNSYTFYEDKFSMDESVRNAYFEALSNNLSAEDANLAYAMLFGNDSNLSQNIESIFSNTGVAHILAVSGLHVGLLVALLTFLLSALKANRKTKLGVVAIFLVLYAYLCGFSPSVMRASIMSLVLLYAYLEGRRFDALSALSFAGVAILLLNPLQLFMLGFQLSFLALFAIITLVPYLNKLFQKLKVPILLYLSISVTISVTIMTFPLLAYYFNQVAVYGVLANLVVVPILSLSYVLTFLFTPIVIAIQAFGGILILPQLLLHLSKLLLNVLNGLPGSVLTVFSDGYITLMCFVLVAFVAKFVMTKHWLKTLFIILLVAVAAGSTVYYNIPITYYENAITATYQTNSNVGFVSIESGEHILVGVALTEDEFASLVNNLRIRKIDAIIAYDYGYKYEEFVHELCEKYGVSTIYFTNLDSAMQSDIRGEYTGVNLVFLENNVATQTGNFTVLPYVENGVLVAVQMKVGQSEILLLKNALSTTYLNMMRFLDLPNYDMIMSNDIYGNLAKYGWKVMC